jgi:hypothetical protein
MTARSADSSKKILAIELGFQIEHHNISAQLLLLFTEASMQSLSSRIAYQI